MRVPSRAFVGVVVFGLITVLVTIPYTLMVLSGHRPGPDAPYELLFPPESDNLGQKIFLVLASVFSVLLLVVAWRALLRGAREDARRRRRHAELKRQVREYHEQRSGAGGQRKGPGPPGFT